MNFELLKVSKMTSFKISIYPVTEKLETTFEHLIQSNLCKMTTWGTKFLWSLDRWSL